MTHPIFQFFESHSTDLLSLAKKFGLLLATAVLVACGPGTGGTGVGPVNASTISGTYLSAAISFAAGAPTNVVGLGLLVTPSAESNWVVVFDAQRISLNNACLSFNSEGVRVESNGQLQIDGLFRIVASGAGATAALPATLIARLDGTGLQVTLRTADGSVLAAFGTAARLADGVVPAPGGTCVASTVIN